MPDYEHIIGGRRVASPDTFETVNPARPDEVLGRFALGDAGTAQDAVAAAKAALPGWEHTTAIERAVVLTRAARIVEERQEELARDMAREVGKPIAEARGEVGRGATVLQYAAGQARLPFGEVFRSELASTTIMTERRPLGVVALITPWNFPFAIPLWKAAPALLYGNTIVLKPAEQSPLMAERLAEILIEAGLPDGVLNVVFGEAEVGRALVAHPDVAGISFTGSTAVGRKVAAGALERGARVQTEMGGKNAVIVLADADLDAAAQVVVTGGVGYAGQKCSATSRVVAEAPIVAELTAVLHDRIAALNVGDPLDESNVVGPVIEAGSVDRTLEYAAAASDAGARLLTGAERVDGPGWFVRPGLLGDVAPDSRFAQEEVFGPLIGVIEARDIEQAAEIANASRYGLVASVCTNRLDAVLDLAPRLRAGIVKFNAPTPGVEPHIPFGGWGESGNFQPEQGLVARDFYTEVQAVYMQGPGR